MLKVIVHDHDDFAESVVEAGHRRVVLAEVSGKADAPDERVVAGQALDDRSFRRLASLTGINSKRPAMFAASIKRNLRRGAAVSSRCDTLERREISGRDGIILRP
jgi:hypothetical protein